MAIITRLKEQTRHRLCNILQAYAVSSLLPYIRYDSSLPMITINILFYNPIDFLMNVINGA